MNQIIQNIIPVLYTHHNFIFVYIMTKHFRSRASLFYAYFVF